MNSCPTGGAARRTRGNGRANPAGAWGVASEALKRDFALAREYLGFLLLNLFDLFLTDYIMGHRGQEANGAAVWVWQRYGAHGFAAYKFLMVLVVVLACEGVALQSARTSKVIVTVGCGVYLAVVFWECFLILTQVNHLHFRGLHPIVTFLP
ncbi:MAG: hypothetical protein JO250_18205 [Armatimonadetes bacterium]|nr:hypothetical protein [Armatimonadota bacterium]